MAGKIGERIRNLRIARGWSISKLSRVSGVSQGYISELEGGSPKVPSAEIVRRLAEALKTSTDYLLGLTDDPAPRPTPDGEQKGVTTEAAYHEPGMPPGLPPEAQQEYEILLSYLLSKYGRKTDDKGKR